MAFDWPTFLEHNGIVYSTSARGVRRGNVGISCPFCGDYTHYHMVISTEGKGWYCWRQPTHKGKSHARLVSALLGCSFEEAVRLVVSENISFVRSDETFADDALRRLGITKDESITYASAGELKFLPEFSPIQDKGLCRVLALPYLMNRYYSLNEALDLSERYGLLFSPRGPFGYRIIIPVAANRKLLNWTGRTVADSEELRYKSLSTDPIKAAKQSLPPAVSNIKDCLFDYDGIANGGELLVVTEGPFDAMRVGFLGERDGIKATCLFGKAATPTQIELLVDLESRYNRIAVLFDQDANFDAFLTMPDYLHIKPVYLPYGCKDPADLSRNQFDRLFFG